MSDFADPAFTVVQAGAGGQSLLCRNAAARLVFLKRLEQDCLHKDGLHPAIRDRLLRIRELPVVNVAMLQTVARFDGHPYLVWQHIPGDSWETATPRDIVQLLQLVDRLHARGIVHGAIHARNIISDPAGVVWITHFSPYLYDDPAVDRVGIVDTLSTGLSDAKLLAVLADYDPQSQPLTDLAAALSNDAPKESEPDTRRFRNQRRRAAIAAAIVLLLTASAVIWFVKRNHHSTLDSTVSYPSLLSNDHGP